MLSAINRRTAIPLFLIGAGFLLLGGVALMLLLRPAAASGVSQVSELPSAIPVAVKFTVPVLSLQDVQGNPASLADYAGQIVLINHWATWCPPCKAEMPVLQAYYDAHRRQGFAVIAIESGEPLEEVAAYAQMTSLTFPVWVDPQESAMQAFKTYTLPSSYVVDRRGQVRLAWNGPINRAMLEKYVTPLLEE